MLDSQPAADDVDIGVVRAVVANHPGSLGRIGKEAVRLANDADAFQRSWDSIQDCSSGPDSKLAMSE